MVDEYKKGRNPAFSFSILQWILLLTIGLTCLVTVSITYILYVTGKDSIEKVVDKLVVEFQERILNTTTASYVNTAVTPLRVVQLLGDSDLFKDNDLNHAKEALKVLVDENLLFSSAQYFDRGGNYLRVNRQADGSIQALLRVQANGKVQLYEDSDENGWRAVADPVMLQWAKEFNPAQTRWFQKASDSEQIVLTQVYINELTGKPVFSCAARLTSEDGAKLDGVIALDFGIGQLSQFLGNPAYFSQAHAFVLNEKGELIAFPVKSGQTVHSFSKLERSQEGSVTYRLLRPDEFEDTEGRALMTQVLAQEAQVKSDGALSEIREFEVSVDGATYFISTFNLNDIGRNTTPWAWQVYILIPETVFLTTIHNNLILSLKTGACILIISILLSYLYSKRLTRPIIETTVEMEKIQDFQLKDSARSKSFIREVTIMNNALENMKTGLRSFEKYVPSDLVRQLIQVGKEASLGGESTELTVFFSDVVDFTQKSEVMEPDALVRDLSHYLGISSDIIGKRGGTIDKFIGDAVMAFWGAPVVSKTKSMEAACLSACEIQSRLKEAVAKGESDFEIRIGIHCGDAIVGNVGSDERMNYTALGDTINLASRLEALNKT